MMKIISPFVDHRDGKRFGPGDYDKIDPPLEQAEIDRLKSAGCLAEGDDTNESPNERFSDVPASRTEMRTESGEARHREADARARDRASQTSARDGKHAVKRTSAADDDGLAGRTKPVNAEPGK